MHHSNVSIIPILRRNLYPLRSHPCTVVHFRVIIFRDVYSFISPTRGRVGGRTGDQGGQGGDQGIRANVGVDEVPDFSMVIAQKLQDLLPTITAEEFMACNLKDYNGKCGAIVYTRWIDKMESVQDMSRCGANQKVKYIASSFISKALTWWNTQKLETEFWCHAMVGADHVVYTDHFHELARLVPHLVTLKNKRIERYIYGLAPQIRAMVAATEPPTIQSVVLKAGKLTDEAIRNGSLKKNTEKRGNGGELSRNENSRDDHKRSRTDRVFATITNHVRKEYTGTAPKARPRMVTPINDRNQTITRGAYFECGGTDHYKAACPRLNRAPRPEGNRQNHLMAIKGCQGGGNNGNQACRGAFMIGAEEAC
ncbi:hypothetical protein Tco_1245631 [Tanacetum coccineum]